MKHKISTLSGNEKVIEYGLSNDGMNVIWKKTTFEVKKEFIDVLMNDLFSSEEWIPLGASQDKPIKNGMGDFINKNSKMTPRHASAIAAILVNEKKLIHCGKKPILLKKV